MNSSNFRYLAAIFLIMLMVANSGCNKGAEQTLESGEATKGLSIGRMRASVWPEYDEASVLAIYDGKFAEDPSHPIKYPIKTSFFVPKGSTISDACSLSYEGQHFCQLYKTTHRGAYDEISLLLPYPNFYLSFHTPRIDLTKEKRNVDYRIKTNHPVKTMEVNIQQPLRSSAFDISPAKGAVKAKKDASISVVTGFNYFTYALNNVAEDQESIFGIHYVKKDPKPSVDIKFTSMKGTKIFGSSPYETQRNIKSLVYILFGAGMLAVIAVMVWLFRSRKKKGGALT